MKNRLKALRKRKSLSQVELGKCVDVSRQTIISIESGKYDPSLPLAFKIAKCFNSTIEEVFLPDDTI